LGCPRHFRFWGNLGNAGCPVLPVEGTGLDVIQAPKPGHRIMRYELTDFESASIRPFLPNKARGISRNLIERFFNKIKQRRRCRDPTRQARGQLSGFRQARIDPHLAACQ